MPGHPRIEPVSKDYFETGSITGFKTFNQVQGQGGAGPSTAGIYFNISRIEGPAPTQRLGLRGGFETSSNIIRHRVDNK
jgi:hypothetical protein